MPRPNAPFVFSLFVSGQNRRADRAAVNLERLCRDRLGDGNFDIEVVDVLESPARAELEQVIATPTIIRIEPLPRRRVIGDLSIPDQAAAALDLPLLPPDRTSEPPDR